MIRYGERDLHAGGRRFAERSVILDRPSFKSREIVDRLSRRLGQSRNDRRIPLSRPFLGREEIASLVEVVRSGILAQGPVVKEFERAFADFCGVTHAVAVSSGTAALHGALYSLGIGPGDEVITTPFTFVSTANSVLMQRARPVFADIDPQTMNLDPEEVSRAVTPRTKAVIAVHLYGCPCEMDYLRRLGETHGLFLVEDACQAHGAAYMGRPAGSLGDAGCFSFYATKNMTCGEGGMVTTDREDIAVRLRRFRHHGEEEGKRYLYRELGYNFRLTDIAASMGIEQLKKLPAMNEIRRSNASLYECHLRGIPGVTLPKAPRGAVHVYHQYVLRINGSAFGLNRDELAWILDRLGVETAVFYPKPLHLYAHFRHLGYRAGDFPRAEAAAEEVLCLPIGPHVSAEDALYVARCIQEVAALVSP